MSRRSRSGRGAQSCGCSGVVGVSKQTVARGAPTAESKKLAGASFACLVGLSWEWIQTLGSHCRGRSHRIFQKTVQAYLVPPEAREAEPISNFGRDLVTASFHDAFVFCCQYHSRVIFQLSVAVATIRVMTLTKTCDNIQLCGCSCNHGCLNPGRAGQPRLPSPGSPRQRPRGLVVLGLGFAIEGFRLDAGLRAEPVTMHSA